MTTMSARPGRIRTGSGSGQAQARLAMSAAAQQAPTPGPIRSSLRAARRAGFAWLKPARMT